MDFKKLRERRPFLFPWILACATFGVVMTLQETISNPPSSLAALFASLESRLMQAYITGVTSVFAWFAARAIRTGVRRLWLKVPLHLAVLLIYAAISVLSVSTARYLLVESLWGTYTWSEFVIATARRSVSLITLLYGIVALAESFHAASTVAREQAVENAELRGRLSETHLEALRLQLQPHFLFNTLHAAAALVDTQPASARRVLSDLGDLLRASLDRGPEPEVTLRRELDLLERYIDIQRVRFGDRLDFRIDVPGECIGLLVPPMILQPLVENSIRHGLADRPGRGEVCVACAVDDSTLRIAIVDDGVGLSEGMLREGVGLGNTRARLKGLYGSAAKIEIASNPMGGTTVRIQLPARPGPMSHPGTLYASSAS